MSGGDLRLLHRKPTRLTLANRPRCKILARTQHGKTRLGKFVSIDGADTIWAETVIYRSLSPFHLVSESVHIHRDMVVHVRRRRGIDAACDDDDPSTGENKSSSPEHGN